MTLPSPADNRREFKSPMAIMFWTAGWGGLLGLGICVAAHDYYHHRIEPLQWVFFGAGIIVVWSLGIFILRRNRYFVSDTTFGFQGLFKQRNFRFSEVEAAYVSPRTLTIVCQGKKNAIKIDPTTNIEWLAAISQRLQPALGEKWVCCDPFLSNTSSNR